MVVVVVMTEVGGNAPERLMPTPLKKKKKKWADAMEHANRK